MPEMSIIDLLFNEGRDGAKEILQNSVVSYTGSIAMEDKQDI
jgi:hypothetical protein